MLPSPWTIIILPLVIADDENGYEKPLGNTSDKSLAIFLDIKLKSAELRIVYKLQNAENALFVTVISARTGEKKYYQSLFKSSYCQEYLDYVCVNEMGELIKPKYVSKHFKALLEKNHLRPIRFHDLRHACATIFAQDWPFIGNFSPFYLLRHWRYT